MFTRLRIVLWAFVGAAALALLGLTLFGHPSIAPDRVDSISTKPVSEIGGPFNLTAHTGQPFTERDVAGRPFIVFFGFTYCPDVCPMALSLISHLLERLGPAADKLLVLFVTVDPERDTAPVLADYLSAFDSQFIGLTGTPEQIAAVAKAWRAYFKKVPLSDGEYTIDHTATIYLHNATGRFAKTLDVHDSTGAEIDKLKMILR